MATRLAASFAAIALLFSALPAQAGVHRGLLFDDGDLPALRARLQGPLQPIARALEVGIEAGYYPPLDDHPIAVADTLSALAFGAILLDPQSAAASKARTLALDYLRGICGWNDWVFASWQDDNLPDLNSAHILFAVSLSWDWLHDEMSSSDRRRCLDRMAVEGERMYQATRNAWWVPEYMQNHNWINHASLGMAALAFDGEIDRDTGAWLAAAMANSEKVEYVLDLIEGGTWHEGMGYLHYGLDSLIPFSIALQRAGYQVDYAANRVLADYARLRMQMMPPAQHWRRGYVLWGDFSNLRNENTLLPLFYAARKWRDGKVRLASK